MLRYKHREDLGPSSDSGAKAVARYGGSKPDREAGQKLHSIETRVQTQGPDSPTGIRA